MILEWLRKELIANISHELKTPLGIVKGFAEGLQDNVAYDKRDRYVAHILSEVDKMNALIMDKEQFQRVWEQFYRGECSKDRKSGGTGLGLAICRHILELHGSTYGVENTKDGVSFYFTVARSIGEVGDNNEHE
jgi:signal transduction histidine kinase